MNGLNTALLCTMALVLTGCERQSREVPGLPGGPASGAGVQQIELQPGVPEPMPWIGNPYADNAQALAEGERLYHWYNCSGCHFAGGGGIGPPLMDADWIYGREPQNIFNTIMEGRPEGMPSYRGRLPQEHAWKIVAYVQSLDEHATEPPDRSGGPSDTPREERQREEQSGEEGGSGEEESQDEPTGSDEP